MNLRIMSMQEHANFIMLSNKFVNQITLFKFIFTVPT